jgi:hypothetical protein
MKANSYVSFLFYIFKKIKSLHMNKIFYMNLRQKIKIKINKIMFIFILSFFYKFRIHFFHSFIKFVKEKKYILKAKDNFGVFIKSKNFRNSLYKVKSHNLANFNITKKKNLYIIYLKKKKYKFIYFFF